MLPTVFELIWRFFMTGLLAVGGGLATLPFIEEMGQATGWFTSQDVLNMIAVSESTPGPLGINMATYVGYTVIDGIKPDIIGSGWFGGAIATLAIITPSIITIIIVSKLLEKFKDSVVVNGAFAALRPASAGLVAAAVLSVISGALLNLPQSFEFSALITLSTYNFVGIAIAAAFFVAMRFFKKVHPIFFILAGALIGIAFKL